MSFQQGLSGLNAAAKNLDIIGNNIANTNSVGFKGSQALFTDVVANAVAGGNTQVGIGTSLSGVVANVGQGNINVTGNALDMAINGQGMFRLSSNGTVSYSRNGQFGLDKDSYIVNAVGARLTGYPATPTGTIVASSPTDLQISKADLIPNPTTEAGIVLNLDSRNGTLPLASAAVPNATGASGAHTTSVASAGGQTYSLTVGATNVFSFTATAGGDTVTAADIDTGIAAATAALTAAGYTVSGTAAAGTLRFTRADGASFNIVVADTLATTPGGFAGADFAAGTNTVNNGATAVAGFNLNDATTYHAATSLSVYDSLGNPHTLSTYYVKTAANTWAVFAASDGVQVGAGPIGTLVFNSSGAVDTAATVLPFALAVSVTTGAVTPLAFDLDYTDSTQFGSLFGVNELTQDGYQSGKLTGYAVSPDGTIVGRYSNGQTRIQGQIVLANFTNPQGLQPLGNNAFGETASSGQPLVGGPSSGNLGVLQSGAVEEANVDMTAELVKMITAQRIYQANAQTIKTQDAVLQTIVNLR